MFEDEAAALEDNHEFAVSVLRANLMTNMAGQLFVRDIEVGDKVRSLGKRKLDITDSETFLRLPFSEAIEHFLERGIMSYADFASLSEQERKRAFAVKNTAMQTMLEKVKADLDNAMQPGGIGLQEFVRTYSGEKVARHYAENVYRTSTATSYQAGRLRQMQDPDVIDAFPYWEYVTAQDDRVRVSVSVFDGAARIRRRRRRYRGSAGCCDRRVRQQPGAAHRRRGWMSNRKHKGGRKCDRPQWGVPSWFKRMLNRKHRAKQRQAIRAGKDPGAIVKRNALWDWW